MGSENSKTPNKQNLPSGSSNRNDLQNSSERLYTENDVQRALENQRRLYDKRKIELQNRIYPNLPREVINQPCTTASNNIYVRPPSAPPEEVLTTTTHSSDFPSQTPYSYQQPSLPRHAAQNPQPSTSTSVSQETYGTRNSIQPQKRRDRSSSRTFYSDKTRTMVNCVTCAREFSANIYQCRTGHSSCQDCKSKMLNCAICRRPITDMRNITLETTIADMTIKNKGKMNCLNEKRGCKLSFNVNEMEDHLKECPLNFIPCPLNQFNKNCSWKGTVKNLFTHFGIVHPLYCQAVPNKEMSLDLLGINNKVLHFINMGPYNFLIYLLIDTHNIYMVTQYFGTKFSASKWIYELHIYQKKCPRRKFMYVDRCQSNATPVNEIIDSGCCAVINRNFAETYLDCGKLTYKVYIKKENNL